MGSILEAREPPRNLRGGEGVPLGQETDGEGVQDVPSRRSVELIEAIDKDDAAALQEELGTCSSISCYLPDLPGKGPV